MTSDEEFEALAQDVSQRAASVECSPETYRNGLRDIINLLESDITASEQVQNGGDLLRDEEG